MTKPMFRSLGFVALLSMTAVAQRGFPVVLAGQNEVSAGAPLDSALDFGGSWRLGQTFVSLTSGKLESIKLDMRVPPASIDGGSLVLEVYRATYGVLPSGPPIATASLPPQSSGARTPARRLVEFELWASDARVTAGEALFLCIRSTGATPAYGLFSNYFSYLQGWGSRNRTGSWELIANVEYRRSFGFQLFVRRQFPFWF